MAVGVLNLLDSTFDDDENFEYLSNDVDIFGYSCLQIAEVGKCYKFVATPCVQNYLTKVWYGDISTKHNILTKFKVFI